MRRSVLLVVGLLVTAPAGGGGGGAEQAEVEALTVELREVHAATVAAHERRAADAAERSAAHVVRAEAHAARGEPLVLDVSTLTQRATQEAAEWAARMALIKESQALVLTHIEDARARDVWDVHVPYETGAGLTPRGIVARVRDAAVAERDRAVAVVESRAARSAP